jgi:predicted RNase H-like nuclease (RuvC/YqgF family)
MMNKYIRYSFFFLFINIVILGTFLYKTNPIEAGVALENAQADKARLESELSALEQEIAQKQKELNKQKGQSVSISRDIAILTTQINKAKLDIKAKNLIIQKLGGEINEKNKTIQTLTTKIENEKESLAQLLRKEREIEDKSIVVLVLSQETISDAYGDIEAFASINKGIQKSVNEIRGIKTETEIEKSDLEKKKNQEIDVKDQLETTKRQVELTEAEKQKLLSISKNKESEYQKVLAEKAQRRAEILSALFNLRDISAIPFGKALEYANLASEITKVRPAFLLAILTQETNLGANQGSCYLTNTETGAGVGVKSGKVIQNVMKPTRDVKPFIEITTALGRDPYKTLVSCPIAGAGGYGGAMGPSQFIPSTWQIIKNRVASALGIKTPDPWNPKDAFMASALYLSDLGATYGSYTAERNAACKYYSGRPCTAPGVKNAFYGDSVMAKAKNIQETMIDPLQN